MPVKPKVFELLDFPKFSIPAVYAIDPQQTAGALLERASGVSFMSYNQIWPCMIDVVRSGASEQFLSDRFKAYKDAWKNEAIKDAARNIANILGKKEIGTGS